MLKKPTYEELEHQVKNLKEELAERQIHDNSIIEELDTRYSSIFESVPTSIVILDKNGEIIDINPYHITHIGKGKMVKKDYLDCNILSFPSVVAAGLQDEHKDVLNGKPINLKCIHYPMTTGGRDRFFNIRGVPLLKNNEVTGAVIIHEDISDVVNSEKNLKKLHDELELRIEERTADLKQEIIERNHTEERLRESETKYRSMMESITDQLYICSPEFKIEYMNPAMIKRLGRDATGETCHEVLHGLDHKCDWCIFGEVAKGETLETNIISPLDGRHYRITNMPIHHQDGTISKMTIYRDITLYVEAIAEKNKAQDQLRQAQKMESIGRLAGGVAHDYNNALTAIMGYTELAMADADSNGLSQDNLNEVLKASKHAKDITRQLLAFASKQTIAPKVLDLNTNIEVMLKMLRSLIGEDIDLAWFPGKNLWPVKMDPSQIDQILANLCVNAKDAIAGFGKITIETSMVVLDADYCSYHTGFIPGGFVMMAISDNGCGMDKKILDNIFEPFFTTKDIEEGTGLGLSTVYGIVKQNNGFTNVYSEPDIGTTITIYLPRDSGKTSEIQEKSTDEIPLGGGETILLVEDDITILKLAHKIFSGLGYKVLAANSSKGAIIMAKEYKNKIHLIVTDVIMPEMYGDELVKRLQSLYPSLKHIFMSGYTANAIAHHGVLDEGVAFIQKPFSQIDLAKIVRRVLDKNE